VDRNVWRTRFRKDYGNVVRIRVVAGDDDDDDNAIDGSGINLPLNYSHGVNRYIL
jgi:hypothetical protein